MGRTHWLAGDIEASVKAFLDVLKIDPEHAQAFHQLSLAYKALSTSEVDKAKRKIYANAALEFEKGFEKYKIDEDASEVTHRYRSLHPNDNRMSQKMIIHGDAK